jgi:cation:H+ antiporter
LAQTVGLLLISLLIILACAELFTNAVEWFGDLLGVNEGVVGSVFAAVGTALPETLIPIVAVVALGDTHHGEEVSLGAILGAPFMLATLAMFITGFAIWLFSRSGRRGTTLLVSSSVLGRDIRFFLMTYALAGAAAFLPYYQLKVLVAVVLIGLYVFYVYRHAVEEEKTHEIESEEEVGEEVLAPLRFQPKASRPSMPMVVTQLLVSLLVMVGGAYMFVQQVTAVALEVGIPALILSLLIAPVATELPEKMNSVLWVRRSKDTLALGNITGAMVFQSCLPVAFGLVFTDWTISAANASAFVSAAMALAAAGLLFVLMRTGPRILTASKLMIGGLFYIAYVGYLFIYVLPQGQAA